MFFSISILLPNSIGSESSANQQASYAALSTLQELTQVTEWVSQFSGYTFIGHYFIPSIFYCGLNIKRLKRFFYFFGARGL
jgi:hypothetical protein